MPPAAPQAIPTAVVVGRKGRPRLAMPSRRTRDLGHARFGVAIGGRVIALDIEKFHCLVDQRKREEKFLREAHQRVVRSPVACGWKLPSRSPTILADFLNDVTGSSRKTAAWPIEERRCTLEPVERVRERACMMVDRRIGEVRSSSASRSAIRMSPVGGNHACHDTSYCAAARGTSMHDFAISLRNSCSIFVSEANNTVTSAGRNTVWKPQQIRRV